MEGLDSLLVFKAFAILAIAVVTYVLIVRRTWSDSIRGVQLIRMGAAYLWENVICALSPEHTMRRSAYEAHERYLRIVHGLMLTVASRNAIKKHRKSGRDQDGNPYTERDAENALGRLMEWKTAAAAYFENLPDEEIDAIANMLCQEKNLLHGVSPKAVKEFLRLEQQKISQDPHRIIGHLDRLEGTFPEHFRDR